MTKEQLFEYIKLNKESGLSYPDIARKILKSDFDLEETLPIEYRKKHKLGNKIEDKMLSAFMLANGYRIKEYIARKSYKRVTKTRVYAKPVLKTTNTYVDMIIKSDLDKSKKLEILKILL